MNYGTVCLLMGIESSLIPFPSEAVIPPAAYVVDNPDSRLHWSDSLYINLLLIALFATLGSVLGAIFNYVLGITLGRPLIYRFAGSRLGHLLMLNVEKIQRAEEYFNKHGNMSTFICRFIPAIRQLVSIPAGMARMRFAPFVGYTALGAFIWNVVLVLIGWLFRGQKELINRYSTEIGILILLLVAAVLLWFVIKWLVKRHRNQTVQS
ncbi:MAG: DedA family protein [Paludibacteraceae bacterium]|nr:DedA family protein [Paludibacteraceae bacterium]